MTLAPFTVTRENLIDLGVVAPEGEDFKPLAIATPTTADKTPASPRLACRECGGPTGGRGRLCPECRRDAR